MMSLLIVQPVLAPYRIPVFEELGRIFQSQPVVYADTGSKTFGIKDKGDFIFINAHWKKILGLCFTSFSMFIKLFYQCDKALHVADFKYVTIWISLILGVVLNKPVFLHGQGGYKKNSLLQKSIYTVSIFLSKGYLCYTDFSAIELKKRIPKSLHKKIFVVANTLYLEPVTSNAVKQKRDIAFIGRIRAGSEIEMLLSAVKEVINKIERKDIKVHLVGEGDIALINKLKKQFDFAIFHGKAFDQREIVEGTKTCGMGVYAGDAGLSVVHYMALGLPVIVHSDIFNHMGPEPSYIKNNVNGLLFERNNVESLSEAISLLVEEKKLRMRLAVEALQTFNQLATPTMANKIAKIVGVV